MAILLLHPKLSLAQALEGLQYIWCACFYQTSEAKPSKSTRGFTIYSLSNLNNRAGQCTDLVQSVTCLIQVYNYTASYCFDASSNPVVGVSVNKIFAPLPPSSPFSCIHILTHRKQLELPHHHVQSIDPTATFHK